MAIPRSDRVALSPDNISTIPFFVEKLVENREDGGFVAIRADLPQGSITKWHSHPRGQLLYVLSGTGRAQVAGKAVFELKPGDSVWFDPGVKHWHGADPYEPVSYLAVQPCLEGVDVVWFEEVDGAL